MRLIIGDCERSQSTPQESQNRKTSVLGFFRQPTTTTPARLLTTTSAQYQTTDTTFISCFQTTITITTI